MEIDITPDPALPPPPADLTAQEKLTVAIPERTEENERRLFRLFKGWTFSERDGQVRQWVYQFGYDIQHPEEGTAMGMLPLHQAEDPEAEGYAVKGLQNAEVHLYEDHNGIVDPTGKKQRPEKSV